MKRPLDIRGEFMQLIQRMPQPVIAQVEGLGPNFVGRGAERQKIA